MKELNSRTTSALNPELRRESDVERRGGMTRKLEDDEDFKSR